MTRRTPVAPHMSTRLPQRVEAGAKIPAGSKSVSGTKEKGLAPRAVVRS